MLVFSIWYVGISDEFAHTFFFVYCMDETAIWSDSVPVEEWAPLVRALLFVLVPTTSVTHSWRASVMMEIVAHGVTCNTVATELRVLVNTV